MSKQGWVEKRDGERGASYRARYWAPNASGKLTAHSKSFSAVAYGGNRKAKAAADAFLVDMIGQVRDGTYLKDTAMTVSELVDRWLEIRTGEQLSGATVYSYKSIIKCHITEYPVFANIAIQKLTAFHIDSHSATITANGAGTSIVLTLHRIVRAALNRAVEWRLIARNPMVNAKRLEKRSRPFVYWTPEESAQFLTTCPADTPYTLIWRLMLLTGMRIGEALSLRWSDLDMTRGSIRIDRTLTRTDKGVAIIGETPKTENSRRTIQLPASCVEPLKQHRASQRERQLAAVKWDLSNGDLVFTRDDGSFIRYEAALAHCKHAVEATGLKRLTPHGMRHSFVTAMLIAGVHPKVVSEIIGDTVDMVLQVYSHVTESSKVNAMANHDLLITSLESSCSTQQRIV